MDVHAFQELQSRVFDLHAQGRFRDALEVAVLAAEKFPEKIAKTAYWMACLYSRLGEASKALSILNEAVREGAWWSEVAFLSDPDFEAVRNMAEFQAIVSECELLKHVVQAAARPELLVFTPNESRGGQPPGGSPPLMITLHWRGGNAKDFAEYWREPALAAGVILALPQSSQVFAKDEFCWDNQDFAESEIARAYAQLKATYQFNDNQVILAGASQGGRIAISMALKGQALPCRGFIAVVPAIRDFEALIPSIEGAAHRGVKGYLVTGEKDQFLQGVKALHAEMANWDLPCELLVEPDLGHQFPGHFPDILASAIDFVLR